MVTKQTVLILGAGASAYFKFPTGADLRTNVIRNLTNEENAEFIQMERELGHDKADIKHFASTLFQTPTDSVDAFLELRRDFEGIGKEAIAQALIPCEIWNYLFHGTAQENWYKYLFGQLRTPRVEQIADNKIIFLTYNYDRSLEHFLFTSIANLYKVPFAEGVAQVLAEMPIIHLHGQLGHLPWEQGIWPSKHGRGYDSSVTKDAIKCSAETIKIIHETADDDAVFVAARQHLEKAERIYLLGFGYGEKNLERLRLHELDPARAPIYGTTWGFSAREISRIGNRLKGRFQLAAPTVNVVNFFRDLADLD